MADVTGSIFNERATSKLRSPDDLDKFVRVTNPSVWILLLACIALLLGLLAWGIFGAVSTSVTTTGVVVDNKAICFVDAERASKINVGDAANVGGEQMTVASIEAIPVSRNEANEILKSDYLVSVLVEGDWAYLVRFDGNASSLANGLPTSIVITTERVAPLSLILNG